jgi:hypothetical protein
MPIYFMPFNILFVFRYGLVYIYAKSFYLNEHMVIFLLIFTLKNHTQSFYFHF